MSANHGRREGLCIEGRKADDMVSPIVWNAAERKKRGVIMRNDKEAIGDCRRGVVIVALIAGFFVLIAFCFMRYYEKGQFRPIDLSKCTKEDKAHLIIESIQDSDFIVISGYVYIDGVKSKTVDGTLVLKRLDNGKCYQVPTRLVERPDITDKISSESNTDYSNSGFVARVSKKEAAFGTNGYEICYYYNNNNRNCFIESCQYMGVVSEGTNE